VEKQEMIVGQAFDKAIVLCYDADNVSWEEMLPNKGGFMKNWKWMLVLGLLVSLVLSLAACGGDSGDRAPAEEATTVAQAEATATEVPPTDTPVPTDTPAPTDTPVPTDTPEPVQEQELDLSNLATPTDLSSYRSNMRLVVSGTENGEQTEGVLEFLIEYTSEPLAQRIVISGEGFGGAEGDIGSIELYRVEDVGYMKLGEEWISMPITDDPLDDIGLISPDDMLADTCGWQAQGTTDYKGVNVKHYALDQADLESCMTAEQMAEIGEITEASGDLYIHAEENYIVAMHLIMEGDNFQLSMGAGQEVVEQGRVELDYEMLDVNAPITIDVPEEALAGGALPEDIPLPEDAQEVNNMFGMISYNSDTSPEELAEFYQAQMPENGWTEVSMEELSGMYMMEYSKDGRTASLIINTDDDTGKTSVLITIDEG
jgi:hypothetical protein